MKNLHWMGSSRKVVKGFPEDVRREVGYSIYVAQMGDKALNALPMVGFGGSTVLEIVATDSGNAFRAVYTVKFENAVYVLHAFQKKSKRGIETPRHEVALIKKRLAKAEEHYRENFKTNVPKEKADGNRSA